jgi:hypothetical protein
VVFNNYNVRRKIEGFSLAKLNNAILCNNALGIWDTDFGLCLSGVCYFVRSRQGSDRGNLRMLTVSILNFHFNLNFQMFPIPTIIMKINEICKCTAHSPLKCYFRQAVHSTKQYYVYHPVCMGVSEFLPVVTSLL